MVQELDIRCYWVLGNCCRLRLRDMSTVYSELLDSAVGK